MLDKSLFLCPHQAKKFKLVFDGGVLGHYTLELCRSCYQMQEKKFLVREESK